MKSSHAFVFGLRQRELIGNALRDLPHGPVASDQEVLHFIDRHQLFSSGIGYIDVHLLAAAQLVAGTTLWTRDKRLRTFAQRKGLAASEQ